MDDTRTALLTEHLSYTPLSLIDDIINSINNLIYQAISSLEEGLTNAPPERLGFSYGADEVPETDEDGNILYPQATLEIENGLHQLETLLESTVDKAFDRFEIYVLRNILTVPVDVLPWVRLNHYENLVLGQELANAPTREDITQQRKKLRETRKLQRALKQEAARNDAIISQLTSMLETPADGSKGDAHHEATASAPSLPNLSFLMNDTNARALKVGEDDAPPKPIATNTAYLLSQLPVLRSTLLQLRGKISQLPQMADQMQAAVKPDEREEYINGRIKLHLQKHGELPSGAELERFAKGKNVDQKEVDALESAIEYMSK